MAARDRKVALKGSSTTRLVAPTAGRASTYCRLGRPACGGTCRVAQGQIYSTGVSNRQEADADEVRRLTLTAFVGGEVDQLAERLAIMRLAGVNPARAVLELAADLFLMTGVTRTRPLDLVDLADRHLADVPVRGNTARQKRRYALTAAVLIAAGVEPEDTSWWRLDDLWTHALDASLAYLRAAAEARGVTPETLAAQLHNQQELGTVG